MTSVQSIRAVTAALTIALVLVCASPSLAAHKAHNLQTLGPAPQECTNGISTGCTFNSWVATFALAPHLVDLGEKITGKVVTLVEHCGDVFTAPCMKSFGWPLLGGGPSKSCPTGPTGGSCTFKATAATHGWTITCASIDALDGAESCDYYAVIGHKRAISGRVLGDDGKPLAGAKVAIRGPSGGSVSTNGDGNYYAVVDPGRYRVALPATTNTITECSGRKAGGACELNLAHKDGQASFTVVTHLKVTVKALGRGVSGLSFDKALEGPAFFEPGVDGQAGKCLSGCTNVEVTVAEPNGTPVQGAVVAASATAPADATIAPYPSGDGPGPGPGHLCQASEPTNCGSSIAAVKTDSAGNAQLLYWAPGLISAGSVKITATASADCAECSGGEGSGEGATMLGVAPYAIYEHDITLGPHSDVIETIGRWWQDDGFFSASSLEKGGVEKLLSGALEALGRKATIVAAATEIASVHSHIGQEQAMTQIFDEQLGLTPFGLAETSPTAPYMSSAYRSLIGGKPGSVLFVIHYGKPGLLLNYGKQLTAPELTQIWKLRVYEVSYCAEGQVCGPGGPSDGAPLKHAVSPVAVDGIHPFLYLEFEGQEPSRLNYPSQPVEFGHPFREKVVIPYQPSYWMSEQQGLRAP